MRPEESGRGTHECARHGSLQATFEMTQAFMSFAKTNSPGM